MTVWELVQALKGLDVDAEVRVNAYGVLCPLETVERGAAGVDLIVAAGARRAT